MSNKLVVLVGKQIAIVAGLSLISTLVIAEAPQLDVVSDRGSASVVMQRVVVPPPSGPYASRLGMPDHEKRFNHRMMEPANRALSVIRPLAEKMTGPTMSIPDYGTYRPEVSRRPTEPTTQAVSGGYAPAYYPPRGYGYPPARPPGYGYRPAPPPSYAVPWGGPTTGYAKPPIRQ